jgi:hypothetical protein
MLTVDSYFHACPCFFMLGFELPPRASGRGARGVRLGAGSSQREVAQRLMESAQADLRRCKRTIR